MAEKSSGAMPIGEVNSDTLELLERRIASRVRTNFMKTVTLPIGGGGLIAIVISVAAYIPAKIEAVVQGMILSHDIQSQVDEVAGEKVEDEVGKHVEGAVASHLNSDAGRKLLADRIAEKLTSPRGEELVEVGVVKSLESAEGKRLLADAAKSYVESEEGREFIASVVKKSLEPTIAASAAPIRTQSTKVVQRLVNDAVEDVEKVTKGNATALDKFADRVEEANSPLPIVITNTIGAGRYYNKAMIHLWLDRLSNQFDDKPRFVVLLYGPERVQGQFVASIEMRRFQEMVEREPKMLSLLNETVDNISYGQAVAAVEGMFGENSTRSIASSRTISEVLRDPAIWKAGNTNVPVLDDNNRMKGVTSRDKLEEAILGPIFASTG